MADPKPATTKFPLDKADEKTGNPSDPRPSGDSPKPHGDPLADAVKGDKDR
ncbi:MAG TPA: hypothetical protein VNQ99_03545 [Xanthobacteraceae bacterium]|nr:hypothetical protein [Xanthobacteraceae bacterium]